MPRFWTFRPRRRRRWFPARTALPCSVWSGRWRSCGPSSVGEVGYWKSRHADAVKRIEQLKEELDQSQGQTRALQDKLFGRKSEKSARSDRSNDLFDPEEVTAAAKKRGAQPGHAGHGRRDYSHLPVEEEFVPLPAASAGVSDLREAGRR